MSPRGSLRTVLYHRIEESGEVNEDLAPDLVSGSPALLEQHLRHIARFYTPVTAKEVVQAVRGRHTLPRGAVLVTFDDGYRDFYDIVWPLLKRLGIPATLFVPTAYVDEPQRVFWWDALWQILSRTACTQVRLPGPWTVPLSTRTDRVRAAQSVANWLKTLAPTARAAMLEQLAVELHVQVTSPNAVLSWPELRTLAKDGAEIAAHSRTHPLLDQLDSHALCREMSGCRDDLVREMGECLPVFAYPNGNANALVLQALDAAGFQLGLTTTAGLSHIGRSDPRLIRRDYGGIPLARLAINLAAPVSALRAYRHPLPQYDWPLSHTC